MLSGVKVKIIIENRTYLWPFLIRVLVTPSRPRVLNVEMSTRGFVREAAVIWHALSQMAFHIRREGGDKNQVRGNTTVQTEILYASREKRFDPVFVWNIPYQVTQWYKRSVFVQCICIATSTVMTRCQRF